MTKSDGSMHDTEECLTSGSKRTTDLLFISFAERKEVQQNQEVQPAGEVHLRRLLQPEEVQAQVLRRLRGRPLLQPPRHQNHPRQVPLRGRRDLQQEHHDDRVLQVHLQLSPCQWSLLPLLPPLQRHPQVQRLIGDERPNPSAKRKTRSAALAANGGPDERRGVNRLPINYQLLVVTRFPRNCGLTSWGLNEVHCLLWLHQHSYLKNCFVLMEHQK